MKIIALTSTRMCLILENFKFNETPDLNYDLRSKTTKDWSIKLLNAQR